VQKAAEEVVESAAAAEKKPEKMAKLIGKISKGARTTVRMPGPLAISLQGVCCFLGLDKFPKNLQLDKFAKIDSLCKKACTKPFIVM
jgi:hypothetical protein